MIYFDVTIQSVFFCIYCSDFRVCVLTVDKCHKVGWSFFARKIYELYIRNKCVTFIWSLQMLNYMQGTNK